MDRFNEIITGSMLGDGCIEQPYDRGNAGNPLFSVCKTEVNVDYLDWIEQELNPPLNFIKRNHRIKITDANMYRHWTSRSSRTPFLIPYRDIWYPEGKKIIPKDFIKENFTDLSLAIWYMDDGYVINRHRKGKNGQVWSYDEVQLCTQGFTPSDVLWLMDFLKERYGFHVGKTKVAGSYRIAIHRQEEITKLFEIIKPYIVPSMEYKLIRAKEDIELEDKKPLG